ncbi:MAG: hypothetical protein V1706_11840 [Pseudomonadota bacterium]
MRTCVTPEGEFLYCIHSPDYSVTNLRPTDALQSLGTLEGEDFINDKNFPKSDIRVEKADPIYEIPHPFPFKGTTFINSRWADFRARNPLNICLPEPKPTSFSRSVAPFFDGSGKKTDELLQALPETVLFALATTSTDPDDLVRLAHISCDFSLDTGGAPAGLFYERDAVGNVRAKIHNHPLFEAVANNPYLPDAYKQSMVLRPGAQGGSEIVGAWEEDGHHVFEYLRRNSYIPWGHFASNMANDAVRYDINNLSLADMTGLRHLYYQRTYIRMAEELGITVAGGRKTLSDGELEELRRKILQKLEGKKSTLFFDCTLWGWNYGFDFAPSRYRLNASHQQIHQQFALLPAAQPVMRAGKKTSAALPSYGCGDLVAECVHAYDKIHGRSFFADLLTCIRNNKRMDKHPGESSLIVYEDEQVMLFVPKAQTSQWELQLMPLRPVGNILEADQAMRLSLDKGIHTAMQILGTLGVRMVTTIEYAKRFQEKIDQRLIYCFLPKLPESPGAFSEAQLRWIMGHFPEDFALACRNKLPDK